MARRGRALALVAFVPAVMGAGGDEAGGQGCGAIFSESDAPDFEGTWAVAYDDSLEVEITLGGAVYTETVGLQGGTIEIEHEGQPLSFDLDCDKPEVACPSEVWPETFAAEQRQEKFQHQVILRLPTQVCDGPTRTPEAAECGPTTDNPDCEDICDGELTTEEHEVFGVIDEPAERFEVLLGAGVASNGINCGLLGVSVASADITSNDPRARGGWQAETLDDGEIVTAYSGGCLWADDVDMDDELEAIVVGAQLRFTTGFSAKRQ